MEIVTVLVQLPISYYFLIPSWVFTTLHTYEEVFGGDESPFWRYYQKCFGHREIPYLLGLTLFTGLYVSLILLGWYGYYLQSSLLLGGLIGARFGDALISHLYLSQRFDKLENPGVVTSYLYLLEGVLATALLPISALGLLTGFSVFALFWLVSFALRSTKDASQNCTPPQRYQETIT